MSNRRIGRASSRRIWLPVTFSALLLLASANLWAQQTGSRAPAVPEPVKIAPGLQPAAPVPAPPQESDLWWETSDQSEVIEPDGSIGVRMHEAARPSSTAPADQPLSYDASFEDDLFSQTDLVLPGISSVQTLTFPRPRMWDLLSGSEMRLIVEHSSTLISRRSHLTVYINDVNIRSFELDDSNVTSTELRIPIPLHTLQDYNVLRLEVQQHYTDECEDPFDPALWTKVSRRSKLHLVYRYKPSLPDLLQYPLPFFDKQGYGSTVLRYVLPRNPSSQTLQALGLVTLGIGREVSYGHLAVGRPLASVDNATGHVLLIGTPQELPEVTRFVGDKLAGLPHGQGIVSIQPNPTNPYAAVLIVSGNDADGVLLAARALGSMQRHKVLSGTTSIITQLIDDKAAELRDRPRFVPTTDKFTFKDLGFKETTVRGFFAAPLKVEVRAMPDMQFYERLQHLKIKYSYGAQVDTRFSTLEVRWNNISLRSVSLANPEGEQRATLDVNVPVEVLAPYNSLEVVFHLLPKSYNPCETKVDHQLWATVFEDSSFEMPRYYYAQMPDLGKLQYGLYPFGLYQDLSQTAVVLADNPTEADLMAGLSLAGELGRATDANRVALQLMRASDVNDGMKRDYHLIAVSTGNPNSLITALRDKQSLVVATGEKRLSESNISVLQAIDPNNHGILEQVVSPWGSEKTITIVQGMTPEFVKKAVRMLTDIRVTSRLSGNVALMGAGDELRTLQTADQVTFGSMPIRVRIEKFGQGNLWMVIVLLLLALALMFVILRYWLGLYRRRHHGPKGDGTQGGGSPAGGGPSGSPMGGNPVSSGSRGQSFAPSERSASSSPEEDFNAQQSSEWVISRTTGGGQDPRAGGRTPVVPMGNVTRRTAPPVSSQPPVDARGVRRPAATSDEDDA